MFGVPELFLLGFLVPPIGGMLFFWFDLSRRAGQFGYASTREYLRAAPYSDAEKRDAVDLALKGIVCCVLGALFPLIILAGLVPLFYGGRKLVYASMGLGLVDDGDRPEA